MVRENSGAIWMSHPYRGVFKIQLQADRQQVAVQRFGKDHGLPSDLFNYVFKIGDIAVVAAERGIYRFDVTAGKFIPATELNHWLDPAQGRTRYLREDAQGNIWFSQGNNVGVLWVEDEGVHKRVHKELFPALNGQLVGGFEHIYPYSAQNVFFGTEKGFMLLNPERLHKSDTTLQVVINSVRFPDLQDSLLYGGFPADPRLAMGLPAQRNNLHFSFSATVYAQADPVQYSVRLEGLDAVWSPWSTKTERDFAHLPTGKYTFMVKARTASGLESAVCTFTFRILPPWYASRWAYLLYAAFFIAVLVASFRRQRVRFEAEKAALTTEHQQQSEAQRRRMEQSEQEIVRLQNEKLENEVQFKNKELALATMHLVQKGEILSSIQEELQKTLQKTQDGKALRDDLQRIMRMVQYDTQLDNDWEQFAVHFDSVYGDFLKRLRERHPQLSPYDLRLSAYLRMNLSSKELAHLMNISVRGVEGSRYRLRKKLNLGGEDHLVEYLMNV
jgi:DNA-binding CsgD family transcriptional regulator